MRKRLLSVIWDSFDKSPEERAFIAKLDWWILSYCCIAYFVKYLDQTNVSYALSLASVNMRLNKTDRSAMPTSQG